MVNLKIYKTPDGEIIYATFNTQLHGDGRRAKHCVFPDGDGFVHLTHFLIPKDEVPEYAIGLEVSERVFFGKMRLVELVEHHLPETWMAIGEIVKKFNEVRKKMNCVDCKDFTCPHRSESTGGRPCYYESGEQRERLLTMAAEANLHYIDWFSFRREAAKTAMQGILASGDDGWSLTLAEGYKPEEKHSYPIGIARFAIACADELIKQLKEEQK